MFDISFTKKENCRDQHERRVHGVRGGWHKPRNAKKKVKMLLASEENDNQEFKDHLVRAQESEESEEMKASAAMQITIECELAAQILEDAQLNCQ